ncbi:MAG: peptide chain release factor N(5)-glutamine methyltransferase [Bacillota bacterium]|nr:peptide chain release factor N(5)-glutamine methyltransferase [Bacillota bacterium]
MTVTEALRHAAIKFKTVDIDAPALEAGVILCTALNKDRSFIYSHGELELSSQQEKEFLISINSRIEGKPLQYITGHQEFMSLDFLVSEHVLIPRQDTEILVETVINHVKTTKLNNMLSILDLCTGSGCIAVSLAYYIKNCRVIGVDVSEQALDVAHLNAVRNNVGGQTGFIKADLKSQREIQISNKADIVVSNPPYIAESVIKQLKPEVRDYEPAIALDGGEHGLDFYKIIAGKLRRILKPGGFIALEIGYDQAESVIEIFGEVCVDLKIIKDLSGNDRVITGFMKN